MLYISRPWDGLSSILGIIILDCKRFNQNIYFFVFLNFVLPRNPLDYLLTKCDSPKINETFVLVCFLEWVVFFSYFTNGYFPLIEECCAVWKPWTPYYRKGMFDLYNVSLSLSLFARSDKAVCSDEWDMKRNRVGVQRSKFEHLRITLELNWNKLKFELIL